MGRRDILYSALSAVLFVFVLAFCWEFLVEPTGLLPPELMHANESSLSSWLHVALISSFAAFAVGIVTVLTLRAVNELRAKEETLRKAENDRLSFAADAAHELRTPLAVLRARVDNMADTEETRQLRDDADKITRIIEQVLAKSRVEALDVKPGDRVDLARVGRDLTTFMAPLMIREGRSIELTGAGRPCVINGNPFAVEHAVRNLLENALKYSARGSTVVLDVQRDDAECRLCVVDRGRGVPEAERDLIFERFRRADRRGTGSGLGLTIVRRVAESHGGRVSLTDAPGGGAAFCLHFPVK